jgi:hypothetical protein
MAVVRMEPGAIADRDGGVLYKLRGFGKSLRFSR